VIADLRPVTVSLGDAGDGYLSAHDVATGRMLWPVAAGELIPRRAVIAGDLAGARLVTVPVDPLRLPPDVMPGDRVDVWSTTGDRADVVLIPQLIVPSVTVASISEDTVGIGGQVAVVLTLAEADVAEVVAASRGGSLDLIAVPLSSQSPDEVPVVEAADARP
jgi:hypothetical protein